MTTFYAHFKTNTLLSGLIEERYFDIFGEEMSTALAKSKQTVERAGGKIKLSDYTLTTAQARKLYADRGRYITVCPSQNISVSDIADDLSKVFCEALTRLLGYGHRRVMAVCIGNPNVTADRLGAEIIARLSGSGVMLFQPNVAAVTSIESSTMITAVVKKVKPSAVVVIDSLRANSYNRLFRSIQLSTVGLSAGSGCGEGGLMLNTSSLGAETVAVGVPLAVYAASLVNATASGMRTADSAKRTERVCDTVLAGLGNALLTTVDAAVVVSRFADIIANGLQQYHNKASRSDV